MIIFAVILFYSIFSWVSGHMTQSAWRRMRRAASASSADNSGASSRRRKMMADSESIEEVAVIGNTDITPTESENNIVNTVVIFGFLVHDSPVTKFSLVSRKLGPNKTTLLARSSKWLLTSLCNGMTLKKNQNRIYCWTYLIRPAFIVKSQEILLALWPKGFDLKLGSFSGISLPASQSRMHWVFN